MNFKKKYTPAKGYTPICKIGDSLSNNPKSQARFGVMNFNLWKFKQKQANEPYM